MDFREGLVHDRDMPKGYHLIKNVLLDEIATAQNFYLCCKAADALFHARLLAKGVAEETARFNEQNQLGSCQPESEEAS